MMIRIVAAVVVLVSGCTAFGDPSARLPEPVSTGAVPAKISSPVEAFAVTAAAAGIAMESLATNEVRGSSAVSEVVARVGSTGRVDGAAFESSGTNQTVITSKQLLFDYKRSIALFEGNVEVVDPQMHMFSDRLIVVFGASNSVQTVTALDNVRFDCGDRKGSCERAVYRVPLGEVLLTGSPVLRRTNGEVLKGERITFWMDREVAVCDKGEVILPSQSMKEKP